MPRCAFEDCGDPTCHLCRLARLSKEREATMDEGKRNAVAVPKARPSPSPTAPKRRHREGPHR